MNIAIVDDELDALELLEGYLQEIPDVKQIQSYADPKKALKAISEQPVDLLLLDINMPEMDGISLAEELLKLPLSPKIIFITAYNQYAIQAFELNALDYLLKPVSFERFQKAIDRYALAGKVETENPVQDNTQVDATVSIACFGSVTIEGNGKTIKFNTSKVEELFIYLWLHKERSIEQISADVFTDFDDERAKQYLHTCIYQIRKGFKDVGLLDALTITNERKSYQLQLKVQTNDQDSFVKLYDEAILTNKIGIFLRAISVYRGDFLQNMDRPWIAPFRETYIKKVSILLERLVVMLLAEQQADIALYFAKQLVEFHPQVADYTGLLLQALILQGNTEEARMVYRDFKVLWNQTNSEDLPVGFIKTCEQLGIVN
jgi:two-component system, LytTR family, response regulator